MQRSHGQQPDDSESTPSEGTAPDHTHPHAHGNAAGDAHTHTHTHRGAPLGDEALRAQARESQRRLLAILVLTAAFAGVEALGGWLSGSLALLADAGHMVTDSSAIGLSLLAVWLGRRAATWQRTYGYRRAELLAAFFNALVLVALAGWIVVEALQRLAEPHVVLGGLMFWVALAGLGVNLVAVRLLHGHHHGSLNMQSALWHVMGDLLGSLGAVSAAVVIFLTGWSWVDPAVSMGIAVLIALGGGRILWDSANLLLDRAPGELDPEAVNAHLLTYAEIHEICDLHIWNVSSAETVLTAHLVVAPSLDRDAFLRRLQADLRERFGLAHMTMQLESEPLQHCISEW